MTTASLVRSTPPNPVGRGRVRSFIEMYRGQFASAIAAQIAYRGATFLWVFGGFIQPLVLIVVWRTVAGPDGAPGGYTQGRFVTYFALEMLVSHLTFVWIMWEMEWRIRTGFYSGLLLRPVHPIHSDIAVNLSYKLVGLIGVLPAAIGLILLFDGDVSGFTWRSVPAFLLALALAMALRFMVEWTLALAAFWLTKVSAINTAFFFVSTFLSGSFAPLVLLPGWVQTMAWWSPFPWSLGWVIEVGMGDVQGAELWRGYGLQLLWIVAALLVMKLVWRRAVKVYSAVGS